MTDKLPSYWLLDDETLLIQQYMFLPWVRKALERDKRVLSIAHTQFERLYIDAIDNAIDRVTSDIRRNKKNAFDRGMTFTMHSWLNYDVIVRGRLHNVSYHKSIAVDWINVHVREYFP